MQQIYHNTITRKGTNKPHVIFIKKQIDNAKKM